jgi:phosphohistidine phosphatase
MKLWLVRHAKSSWADPGQADFDRPLNGRGQRDGPRMATWLSRQQHPATWLWTSDAARALATAEFVREGFAVDPARVHEVHELYLADPETMLDVIRRTPGDVESVAVVAHNPGTTMLLNELVGERVTDNVPTFGVARLSSTAPWHEFRPGCCRLEVYSYPKGIDSAPPA